MEPLLVEALDKVEERQTHSESGHKETPGTRVPRLLLRACLVSTMVDILIPFWMSDGYETHSLTSLAPSTLVSSSQSLDCKDVLNANFSLGPDFRLKWEI